MGLDIRTGKEDFIEIGMTESMLLLIITLLIFMLCCSALRYQVRQQFSCPALKFLLTSLLMTSSISAMNCFIADVVLIIAVHPKLWVVPMYRIYVTLYYFTIILNIVFGSHIALISIQRYVAVLHPLKLYMLSALHHIRTIVKIIWITTLLIFGSMFIFDYVTKMKYNIARYADYIKCAFNFIVILIIIYVYPCIMYSMLQRNIRFNRNKSSGHMIKFTSFLHRSIIISGALGAVFVCTFLPLAIGDLFYTQHYKFWPAILYLLGHGVDATLVIWKGVARNTEQKMKGRNGMLLKEDF